MRTNTFSLRGILKVRQYKETLALQTLMQDTKEDRQLAAERENLAFSIEQIYAEGATQIVQKFAQDEVQYKFDYVARCKNRRVEIEARKKAIEPKVTLAYQKYNKVRLELESIKILEDKYNQNQKKRRNRAQMLEMQERIAW